MSDRLQIAVVGAGPSGIYVTEALVKADAADIDVTERLPAPFGLLRDGVAPDHHRIKSLIGPMGSVFEDPRGRFLGGVEVGSVVAATDLMSRYDAVVYATGAPESRPMGITGEGLEGSLAAAQLVSMQELIALAAASRDVRLHPRAAVFRTTKATLPTRRGMRDANKQLRRCLDMDRDHRCSSPSQSIGQRRGGYSRHGCSRRGWGDH
jgi:ferredoxin/flavodoxin---NADP+ reductase